MQSVVETNCSHAFSLFALGLNGLLEFGEELRLREELGNLQQLLAEDFERTQAVVFLGTPPRVERLVLLHDHRPDFESDHRHEVCEAVHIEVTPTVLGDAGDTPEVILGTAGVTAEEFTLANHLLQAGDELGTTAEDLRLAFGHVVAVLVIANGGENQHDGNRVGVREHRLVEDERRRSVGFARGVLRVVLLNGAGLAVGMSIAHVGVVVWFGFASARITSRWFSRASAS